MKGQLEDTKLLTYVAKSDICGYFTILGYKSHFIMILTYLFTYPTKMTI